jgi:hypothetical protein
MHARNGAHPGCAPRALHTESTAQVSEWFNVSETAKKLYYGKSNSEIAVMITTMANRDLKLKFISIRKQRQKKKR